MMHLNGERRLDSSALDGLRGVACLHVMVGRGGSDRSSPRVQAFHYVGEMTAYSVWLCGPMQMPLFYLLSGFCLAIGYGKTSWKGAAFFEASNEGEHIFGTLKFYRDCGQFLHLNSSL